MRKIIKSAALVFMMGSACMANDPVISSKNQFPSNCGTSGYLLKSNGNCSSTWISSSGFSTSPGGSTTQVQFNSSGSFGADSGFVYSSSNVGIGTSAPSGRLEVSSGGSSYLLINPTGQRYNLGDLNLAGNGSRILINDSTQEVYVQGNSRVDLQARTGTFGDGNAVGNSTLLTIDDPNTRFTFIGGNVGIGTASPAGLFQIGNSTLTVLSSGNVGIGTATPSSQLHTTGSVRFANFGAGACTFDASGNVSSASDERMKNIQGKFQTGVGALLKIDPIIYKWNKKSGMEMEHSYVGFSAQNIQKAIPEAVGKNKDGTLSLQDRALLATVVNAIKDLQSQISELKKKEK